MSGRSRRKKLVRTKRLAKTDSELDADVAAEEQTNKQQCQDQQEQSQSQPSSQGATSENVEAVEAEPVREKSESPHARPPSVLAETEAAGIEEWLSKSDSAVDLKEEGGHHTIEAVAEVHQVEVASEKAEGEEAIKTEAEDEPDANNLPPLETVTQTEEIEEQSSETAGDLFEATNEELAAKNQEGDSPVEDTTLLLQQTLEDTTASDSNVSSSDDRQTVVQLEATKRALIKAIQDEDVDEASKRRKTKLLAAAASSWRAAADMGDNGSATGSANQNPKWRVAAVKAVTSTSGPTASTGNSGSSKQPNGGLKTTITTAEVIPPPPSLPGGIPQPPPPGISQPPPSGNTPSGTGIAPPPGPWGDRVFNNGPTSTTEASTVMVDMGKVVGVLRAAAANHQSLFDQDLNVAGDLSDDEESTFDDGNADSLVLAPEPRHPGSASDVRKKAASEEEEEAGCATCAAASSTSGLQNNNSNSSLNNQGAALLHPNSAKSDVLGDDSLCGDPLMYATFVAPVCQYSTETEPSRQASFNYPSRQPSFKQNRLVHHQCRGCYLFTFVLCLHFSSEADGSLDIVPPQQPLLSVPPKGVRASATPERIYVDEVQDIYAEVPPDWPLPPIPRHNIANRYYLAIAINVNVTEG